MRLVLTRPRAQCADWLARLAALGVDAVALPLIAIEAGQDEAAASRAWERLPGAALAMFVSPNAVERFFAARPVNQSWPAGVLAATVGPGSAQALLAAGVPAELLRQPPADAQSFDSEHLWPLLASQAWQGRRTLMLRGEGGRDWLADRLRERGAEVESFNIYCRACPRLDEQEQGLLDQALQSPLEHVWLFSSSEAVQNLVELGGRPGADSLAIATHARIAETARSQGWAHVVLARPDANAVAAAYRTLLGAAPTII